MKTLWFKQCYIAPILAREKKDTIRRESNRLPKVGEVVALTVGPRPAFGQARIMRRERIDPTLLPEARRKEVLGIYQDRVGMMVRIWFELV